VPVSPASHGAQRLAVLNALKASTSSARLTGAISGVRTGSAALGYDPRRIHQRKTTGLRVHHTECVIEPWCGFFVAAYVTELAGAFYGYAKVYESEPEDAWSSNALIKVSSTECPCPVEALDSAFERAFAAIHGMYAGHAPVLWRELLARAAVGACI
jgi:hypothetical protein